MRLPPKPPTGIPAVDELEPIELDDILWNCWYPVKTWRLLRQCRSGGTWLLGDGVACRKYCNAHARMLGLVKDGQPVDGVRKRRGYR
jgi:hypothetical protein